AGEAFTAPLRKADERLPSGGKPTFSTPEGGEGRDLTQDFGGLIPLLDHIREHLAQDAQLSALIARLPEYLREGDMLQVLLRNLFPRRETARTLNADGEPVLSRRETEVLREAAGDRSQKEIAECLGVTVRTVNTHFDNIYK